MGNEQADAVGGVAVGAVPVVAVDGPGGSGKGTVAQALARGLGWNYLDSGALYRVLGYLAVREGVAVRAHAEAAEKPEVEARLAELAGGLRLKFAEGTVWLGEEKIGDAIRNEEVGEVASRVASLPMVRERLLLWQRQQAKAPGLVADGRDMGTVVFASAACKIFLTASAEVRAARRFKELSAKGFNVTMARLLHDIQRRDARDTNRAISPLRCAEDAFVLDTTELSIAEAISAARARVAMIYPRAAGQR